MLSKTDLKIIAALEEDGRISFTSLAKKLGISIPTVHTRVKALLKDGVFTICAIPNPFKLGYQSQAIIALNIPMNRVQDVCKRLSDQYSVNMIITTFGRFNILARIQSTDWNSLYDFVISELMDLTDIGEIELFPVRELPKGDTDFQIEGHNSHASISIDETNQKILEALAKNGRLSSPNLAKKLGISASAVSRRISFLLNEDIIKIQAIAKPDRVGYLANAVVLMRIDRNKIDEICAGLSAYDEVTYIMTLASGYDIYMGVAGRESNTLHQLIRSLISSVPGIIDTETLVFGEVVKRYYGTSPRWIQSLI